MIAPSRPQQGKGTRCSSGLIDESKVSLPWDVAPMIVAVLDVRIKIRRTIQQAMIDNAWLNDIRGDLSYMAHIQLIHLQHVIATTPRDLNTEDVFRWPCEPSRLYTARSTYERLCQGLVRSSMASCIWRSWATLKCKIFVWLAVQYRIWTSDRRARHGLQDVT